TLPDEAMGRRFRTERVPARRRRLPRRRPAPSGWAPRLAPAARSRGRGRAGFLRSRQLPAHAHGHGHSPAAHSNRLALATRPQLPAARPHPRATHRATAAPLADRAVRPRAPTGRRPPGTPPAFRVAGRCAVRAAAGRCAPRWYLRRYWPAVRPPALAGPAEDGCRTGRRARRFRIRPRARRPPGPDRPRSP